jgi:aryl-alcohol dehydrogenase-like predicted oxidoreductase
MDVAMKSAMKRRTLGQTDLEVSELCLGTNQFGSGVATGVAEEILDSYVSLGGNFLDTAHAYGDWAPSGPRSASEGVLGRWLSKRERSGLVVATKGCEFDYRAGDYALRVTPSQLDRDLGESLECLGLDRIDLYWLHRDDPSQPVEAIVDALIEQQRAGRIRHFGCSNWSVARIEAAQRYARSIGHAGFAACQPMWGLAVPDRTAMQRYSPGGYYEDGYRALHEGGMAMIPYSGQSRGFFTKLAAGAGAGLGDDVGALYLSDANRRKLPVIEEIAARHGASINDVVLAYLLSQPLPTLPIIGATRAEQVEQSVRACSLRLDAGELEALRAA